MIEKTNDLKFENGKLMQKVMTFKELTEENPVLDAEPVESWVVVPGQ